MHNILGDIAILAEQLEAQGFARTSAALDRLIVRLSALQEEPSQEEDILPGRVRRTLLRERERADMLEVQKLFNELMRERVPNEPDWVPEDGDARKDATWDMIYQNLPGAFSGAWNRPKFKNYEELKAILRAELARARAAKAIIKPGTGDGMAKNVIRPQSVTKAK